MSLRAATAALCLALAAGAAAAPVTGRLGTPTGVVPALTLYAWSLTGAQLYSVTTEARPVDLHARPATRPLLAVRDARRPRRAAALRRVHRIRGLRPRRRARTPRTATRTRCARSSSAREARTGHRAQRLAPRRRRDRATSTSILGRPDGGSADEAQLAAPKFSEYPAAAPGGGARRRWPPAAATRASSATARRSRRRSRSAPNFAGRMVLVLLGCGSGCEQAALVDVATGRVAYPPALAALPASTPCSSRGPLRVPARQPAARRSPARQEPSS